MAEKSKVTYGPARKPTSWDDATALNNSELNQALMRRYGTKNWKHIADAIAQELGLGAYKIPVGSKDLNPEFDAEGFTFGQYSHPERNLKLDPRAPSEALPAVMAHELAHTADYVYGETPPPPEDRTPNLHHKAFQNFEAEMPYLLNKQAEREMGLPLASKDIRRYPWLSKLNPYSSNKLPHPWTALPNTFPVDIWNALYAAQANKPPGGP